MDTLSQSSWSWQKSVGLGTVCLTVFILVPSAHLRLLCLSLFFWSAAIEFQGESWRELFIGLLALAWGGMFLLMPVARKLAGVGAVNSEYEIQLGLILTGTLWVWRASRRTGGILLHRLIPSLPLVGLWALIWVGLNGRVLPMDFTYGGDEGYHAASIHACRIGLAALVKLPVFMIIAGAWLGWGGWLLYGTMQGNRRDRMAFQPVIWGISGVLLCSLAAFLLPADLLRDTFFLDRAIRFPGAEPWLSAALGQFTLERWADLRPQTPGMMRLLPMLAILFSGFYLAGHPRWRKVPPTLTVLALTAALSTPILLYHASLVYLELPLLFLLILVLGDSRHWLTDHPVRLRRRLSWWAILLLGFTKETALPLLLILLGARIVMRGGKYYQNKSRTARDFRRFILGEAEIVLLALVPLLLYLIVRYHFESRPYGGQYLNMFSPALWWRNFCCLTWQFGLLLPLALAGAVQLWRQKRWAPLFLSASCLLGMQVFMMCDHAIFVGLPRFNLYLLPPLLIPAWHGLGVLRARFPAAATWVILLWLGGNLWLSPVNLQGQRQAWGMAMDISLPFSDCMLDLRDFLPTGVRGVVVNMEAEYPLALTGQLIGYPISQLKQLLTVKGTPESTLNAVKKKGYDLVIYVLSPATRVQSLPRSAAGYQLMRVYGNHGGGQLALYLSPAAFARFRAAALPVGAMGKGQ